MYYFVFGVDSSKKVKYIYVYWNVVPGTTTVLGEKRGDLLSLCFALIEGLRLMGFYSFFLLEWHMNDWFIWMCVVLGYVSVVGAAVVRKEAVRLCFCLSAVMNMKG